MTPDWKNVLLIFTAAFIVAVIVSGYYGWTLITRIDKLELWVPQDRQGRFRTEIFERCQRGEKALVAALSEMYVPGVSTRKVKAVTEGSYRYEFSARRSAG
jgi:putative transposase